MYLPPLGAFDREVLSECFRYMEHKNNNRDISRIENVEEDALRDLELPGLRHYRKNEEYILSRRACAELPGVKYRHQRNLCNYFGKNNDPYFRPYKRQDKSGVLALHRKWKAAKRLSCADPVYQAMLDESGLVLKETLGTFGRLGWKFFVAGSGGRITAFSCGFAIAGKGPFCVNLEFTDPERKGASAYVFREFCRQLEGHEEINIMDDSGFENLKKAKELYHPSRKVPSYTILATDGI